MMKKLGFHSLLVAALLTIVAVGPADARAKKKKELPPVATVISAVSPGSITIMEGSTAKTFAITQFTEVTVKGQRAKVSDLQPGMSVSVTLGTDPTKASRITAGDPPAQPPSKR
jgi:hypothetical protein